MKKVTEIKGFKLAPQEKDFFEGLMNILGYKTDRALFCDLSLLGLAVASDLIPKAIANAEKDAGKYEKVIMSDSPKELIAIAEKNKDRLKSFQDIGKGLADHAARNLALFTDSPLYSFYTIQKEEQNAANEKRV